MTQLLLLMALMQCYFVLSSNMHKSFVHLFVCREDVSNNLTVAVAPDDFKDESQLDANDFLIRGIIGIDPKGGAIAVGDTVGVGKRIRFMVGLVANNHLLCTQFGFVASAIPTAIAADIMQCCMSWCCAGSWQSRRSTRFAKPCLGI